MLLVPTARALAGDKLELAVMVAVFLAMVALLKAISVRGSTSGSRVKSHFMLGSKMFNLGDCANNLQCIGVKVVISGISLDVHRHQASDHGVGTLRLEPFIQTLHPPRLTSWSGLKALLRGLVQNERHVEAEADSGRVQVTNDLPAASLKVSSSALLISAAKCPKSGGTFSSLHSCSAQSHPKSEGSIH